MARRILVLQAVVLIVMLAAILVALRVDADQQADEATGARVTAIAETMASAPQVLAAVTDPYPAAAAVTGPSAVLQPFALDVGTRTGADFVVVMAPDGTRWTHPDPSQIGRTYLGNRDVALAGGTGTETYVGTLGPSIRAITPVTAPDGTVVALVSVGVTVDHIGIGGRWITLGLIALGALVIGVVGSLLIARWVRRQTLGMGPQELGRMFSYYDAVLASAHNGMVLLDTGGRIVLANPEARRLLDLPESVAGSTPQQAGFPAELVAMISGGGTVRDELVLTADRVLLFNRRPAQLDGRTLGAVVSVRDHTELENLTGELDRAHSFATALRAQAHESANRLHTVISLIELGEPEHALDFAVQELQVSQALADRVVDGVGNRAVAALLLGKTAQAAERGIELVIRPGSELPEGAGGDQELVTVIGNLIDNAMDALSRPDAGAHPDAPRRIVLSAASLPDFLEFVVQDSGPGLDARQAEQVFAPGWSTNTGAGPAGDRGLGLALVAQAVARLGGRVWAEAGPGARFVVRLPPVAAGADDVYGQGPDRLGAARPTAHAGPTP
ncbi:sensor histidine kinase [Nakamurella flavida]|uniref:Sensor-like histidine kinase SenX3 n=1 Tax=Nakamurella flavida TaxID=363630 RepID=A0A938YDW4_9ACTN|nr:sensor histidine kinase [Nakamurella flavida]MBM9475881.1 sensor histidine kinase [Nakamurella flavida]MDP9777834.1 sensor histidine kinase regulating citrate/malate metabolism [Nakamurella flavida]